MFYWQHGFSLQNVIIVRKILKEVRDLRYNTGDHNSAFYDCTMTFLQLQK